MTNDPGIRFEAALFDFDGVLVDSERDYERAFTDLIARNCNADDADTAYSGCIGRSWSDIFQSLQGRWPGAFTSTEAMIQQVESEAVRPNGVIGEPVTDSIEMMHRLAALTRVCIVTGASRNHATHVAQQLGFDRPLEFILGCEDYGPGKPDPTPYRVAAQRLGVAPERCVVFEDSPAGVASAKAAGMTCVRLLPRGAGTDTDAPADLIVHSLMDETLWQFLLQVPTTDSEPRPA